MLAKKMIMILNAFPPNPKGRKFGSKIFKLWDPSALRCPAMDLSICLQLMFEFYFYYYF